MGSWPVVVAGGKVHLTPKRLYTLTNLILEGRCGQSVPFLHPGDFSSGYKYGKVIWATATDDRKLVRKIMGFKKWFENGAARSAFRISLIYFIITGLWILLSDQVIAAATRDFDRLTHLQTYKGMFFIGATSLLLYLLMRYEFRLQHQSQNKLVANEQQMRILSESEREQRTLAGALRDTAAALSSTLDLPTVLNLILDHLRRVVPHDLAKIILIRAGTTFADIACQRSYQPEFETNLEPFSLDTPSLKQMIATGKYFLVPDTDTFAGWVKRPHEQWMRSNVAVPIRVQNETIGFLSVASHTANFFDQTHAERLQAFADQSAIAIKNAQLFAEVLHYADDLEQRVEERTRESSRAKEQVETILNSSSDAIILISPDMHIRQTNPAFRHTFLYQPGDIHDQLLSVIAHSASIDTLVEAVRGVAADETPRRIEITAQNKLGEPFEADIALSPSMDEAGLGIVCSVRDISARKQMEAQLRKMLQREMETNELKSKFVSMISHEFRTPLTIIRVSTDMLQKYNARLTDEQKGQEFERVRIGIRQMTDLLEDVLTLSRSESGVLKFSPAEVDLDELCRAVLREIETSSDSTHTFHYSCIDLEGMVWLDQKLLRHILGNLLTNAVKYSPAGSTVDVNISMDGDATVAISVRDQGTGIPEEAKAHLFEPFYRAKNAETVIGSGLGLAIAKQAVELHHGTITFENDPNQGTTFRVRLPAHPPHA